jgi:hypothetical protein
MNKLPTACRHIPPCAEHAVERGYCKVHALANPRVRKTLDETDKMYQNAAWKKCSRHHREMNPICQLIVKGKQCTHFAELSHHIVSPRKDPSLFLAWWNLVSLCWSHHDDREGDNPRNPKEYAPTQGILGAVHVHPKPLRKMEVRIGEGGVAEIG